MTRFKELRRIEAAIEHRNQAELRWAADYCRMRIRIAPRNVPQNTGDDSKGAFWLQSVKIDHYGLFSRPGRARGSR